MMQVDSGANAAPMSQSPFLSLNDDSVSTCGCGRTSNGFSLAGETKAYYVLY